MKAAALLWLVALGPATQAARWLLLGGYTGIEGRQESGATGQLEILGLGNTANYEDETEWCHRNLSLAPKRLDGATMAEVSSFKYIKNRLAGGDKAFFTSSHHSAQFHRLLVCGGADEKYEVQNTCNWWLPATDTWEVGPKMLYPRYQAATVSLPHLGQLWMLGGRDGSTTLQDNEVLQYPADFNKPGKSFLLKRWEWAHKKMKNSEVWNNAIVGASPGDAAYPGIKKLPMPLSGHCAVLMADGAVLVIGGGTNNRKEDGTFKSNSGPVPTDHVHLYKNGQWSSTLENSDLVKGTRALNKMNIPRMNHACLRISNRVYVAGGVTRDNFNQSLVVRKVERFDYGPRSWQFEADLPNLMTGFKLINVAGRPTVVGRYGAEQTNRLLRYSSDKVWLPLPTKLLLGRSDFQIMDPLPDSILTFPVMSSTETRFNKGSGSSAGWRNKWGSVVRGVRQTIHTNEATQPWLQLDLGSEVTVRRVWFESGACTTCDGTPADVLPQDCEVRVGNDPVPTEEEKDQPITVNRACGSTVDGSPTGNNGKRYANCQDRPGRYVTLQLVDAAAPAKLKISNVYVEVVSSKC